MFCGPGRRFDRENAKCCEHGKKVECEKNDFVVGPDVGVIMKTHGFVGPNCENASFCGPARKFDRETPRFCRPRRTLDRENTRFGGPGRTLDSENTWFCISERMGGG